MSDVSSVRLDTWLWAARFFKTRAVAAAAIDGGKVEVNGARAKRAKQLRVGDRLRVRKDPFHGPYVDPRSDPIAAPKPKEDISDSILLVGVDLYFRGKLEALLDGHHLVTSDSADWPDLVIADVGRIKPEEVVDAYPEIPILGFTNHTDTDGLRRAHAAGFDQVVAKSALVERARDLVDELIPSP